MQKFFSLLLALIACAGTIFAESGTCGENLTWDLTNGVLTISGTGAMTNFEYQGAPWYSYKSSITEVTIGNSVTSIGGSAFYRCTGLTSITIPNSVTSIGNDAFRGCSGLTSITIPNSVTSIGEWAFCQCSGLTSITIPNSVTSIGSNAFYGCSGLTSITIPNSVTSIGESAFWGCTGLTSITIPNSVTSIGVVAFGYCSGLTSITIPNSVTSIGNFAFNYCSGLTSITCHALTPPTCGNYVFNNVDKSIPLYVPEESIELYQTANVWNEFTNIQAISTVDIDQIQLNSTVKNHKILYNGSVYILTGDKTYTVTGQQLK